MYIHLIFGVTLSRRSGSVESSKMDCEFHSSRKLGIGLAKFELVRIQLDSSLFECQHYNGPNEFHSSKDLFRSKLFELEFNLKLKL